MFSSENVSACRGLEGHGLQYIFAGHILFFYLIRERTCITHTSLPLFLLKNIFAWLFRLNPLEVSECLSVCVCVCACVYKCDTQWPLSFPAGLVAED